MPFRSASRISNARRVSLKRLLQIWSQSICRLMSICFDESVLVVFVEKFLRFLQ